VLARLAAPTQETDPAKLAAAIDQHVADLMTQNTALSEHVKNDRRSSRTFPRSTTPPPPRSTAASKRRSGSTR